MTNPDDYRDLTVSATDMVGGGLPLSDIHGPIAGTLADYGVVPPPPPAAPAQPVVEALESLARYAEDVAEKDAQSATGLGASSAGAVGALSMYIGGQTAAKAIAAEARSRAAALRSGEGR